MSITRAGRPRLTTQRRPGTTARDEILDAAGELFTTLGYTGTSTRTIAEAVGIRQASLYHYFKTKDDILCALLSQTVTPTLMVIDVLARHRACAERGRAPARACALRRPPTAGRTLEPRARYICSPNCAGRVSSRSGRTVSGCGCTIWR